MTSSGPKPSVRHDVERQRYVVTVGGSEAGHIQYRLRDGRYLFAHTEIDDAHGGQGVGSVLARAALDDVRTKGATVVPQCWFIAGWIERHPEYADLVDVDVDTWNSLR